MIPLSLAPDAKRGRMVSERMGARLAESLDYVFAECEGRLDLPSAAERAAFLQRLGLGPVPPIAFGLYCDLVLAISADRLEEASRLLRQLVSTGSAKGLEISALSDPGSDEGAGRIQRLIDTDPTQDSPIIAPEPAHAARCEQLIRQALEMISRGHPELAGEFDAMIRQVVMVDTLEGSDLTGASSFMMWGLIVLNARVYAEVVDVIGALIHESGHNLLFGLCADGPLVLNEDEELFDSPLRLDARPMDGVVHAVYVVARMHQGLATLLKAGVFDKAQAEKVRAGMRAEERAFARGRATVRAHARLSPLGEQVMAGVDAYMEGVLASVA